MPRLRLSPLFATAAAAALAALTTAACAPDSVRNYEAHGLNKYLNTIQSACADTRLGNRNLGEWLRSGATDSDSDYVYWLDQTSRLYYSRITVPQYRDAIAGAMGGVKPNADALDCIVRRLPPDRPTKPPSGLFQ